MSVERMGRGQKAVLWRAGANGDAVDGYGRQTVEYEPEEILVRWNRTDRVEMGPKGKPVHITADVEIAPDLDIPHGSILWEGGMDDLPGTGFVPERDTFEVMTKTKIPDIKGRSFKRSVGVTRRGDDLPGYES